jgi:uncharacterized membrane protein YkoI
MNLFLSGLAQRAGWSVALLAASTAAAGALPPGSAKPLSEVLTSLDAAGYTAVTDVEFDDGRWEVEALKGDAALEIHVDPQSAKVVSEVPDAGRDQLPADAKPLAAVVKQLEAAGYLAISGIDLEGAFWEIEATRAGMRYEVLVDARTGKVVSERPEND